MQAGGSIYFGGGVNTGTNTDLTFNLASGQTNATETVFLGQFTGANLTGGNSNSDTIKMFQLQNVASLVVNSRDIAGANGADVVAFNGTVNSPGIFTGAGVESIAAQVTSSSIGQSPSSGITVSVNNSGIASVSGATGTAAIQALQNYLDKAVLPGQTSPGVNGNVTNQVAAIVVNGDTYLVHNGAQNNTADDMIVKLVGITAETQISTTQFGTTTIHIA